MKEKNKEPLFHIVKRDALPWYKSLGIRFVAILLALILCGIITTITTGINPLQVYQSIILGAFGSVRKTWVTFQNKHRYQQEYKAVIRHMYRYVLIPVGASGLFHNGY